MSRFVGGGLWLWKLVERGWERGKMVVIDKMFFCNVIALEIKGDFGSWASIHGSGVVYLDSGKG